MKLGKLTPVLYTNELQQTVDFYVNILGFACLTKNIAYGWATLALDEVEIMLCLPNEHIPFYKPVFTGSFYIKTNDVDSMWEKLTHAATVCYDLENFEYGMREFAVYDNNGYLIQFGQQIS